jgi:hypothetical protein
MKIAAASLVLGLSALLAGCVSSDSFVRDAVRRSKAYEYVWAQSSHPTFVIEEKHASHAIVALGEMPETTLKRLYTLRVNWTGRIEQMHVDETGRRSWVADR